MKKEKNLKQLAEQTSNKLCDTLPLLDILYDITNHDAKYSALINSIKNNVRCAFYNNEKCRNIISGVE